MRLVPCEPSGGLLFGARLLRFSWVWISTSKFLLRGRQKNLTLTTKRTLWCLQMPPSSVPLPGEPEIEAPIEVGSPTSVARTSPSDLHGLEVRVIEAAQSPASDI